MYKPLQKMTIKGFHDHEKKKYYQKIDELYVLTRKPF